jgi:hypothetical protein
VVVMVNCILPGWLAGYPSDEHSVRACDH